MARAFLVQNEWAAGDKKLYRKMILGKKIQQTPAEISFYMPGWRTIEHLDRKVPQRCTGSHSTPLLHALHKQYISQQSTKRTHEYYRRHPELRNTDSTPAIWMARTVKWFVHRYPLVLVPNRFLVDNLDCFRLSSAAVLLWTVRRLHPLAPDCGALSQSCRTVFISMNGCLCFSVEFGCIFSEGACFTFS